MKICFILTYLTLLFSSSSSQFVNVICSNGRRALQACFFGSSCPTNYQCQNGYCCESVCPNGAQSSGQCNSFNRFCPSGYACTINNYCCRTTSSLRCSNGVNPIAQCSNFNNNCRNYGFNYVCESAGCCQQNTITTTGRCSDGTNAARSCRITSDCPYGGYTCVSNVGCCRGSTTVTTTRCSNGNVAVTPCGFNNICPSGYVCQSAGCCLSTVINNQFCPSGLAFTGYCNTFNRACSSGSTCYNFNVCCGGNNQIGLGVCSDGTQAVAGCFNTNGFQFCGGGYVCQNGRCCRSTTTSFFSGQCPNGQTTNIRCTLSNTGNTGFFVAYTCPSNYVCYNNQYCCQNFFGKKKK